MKRKGLRVAASISSAVFFALFGTSTTGASAVPARHSSAAQRQSLTLTIYNGFALVRDVRLLDLDRGENRVIFDDVSPQMSPETAFLTDLSSGAPIWVHEQNFETAVLSPDVLFSQAVGHTVTIIRDEPPGHEKRETAILVSQTGPILKFKDRVETSLPPNARIVYSSIPPIPLTPDFLVDFDSPAAAPHPVALGYLCNGLSWSADYVARLNAAADQLDVDAFITLHNDSGMPFDNATVRVVAGSVQRAQGAVVAPRTFGSITAEATADVYAVNNSAATRQAVFDFYEYRLPQQTSLRTGETKQTLLLDARGVPVRTIYSAISSASDYTSQGSGEARIPVGVTLEFENDGHGLGVPLPSGIFHLYKADQSGEPVFIGDDGIDNTPRSQPVQLDLGPSFDIRVRRVQTNYQEIPHPYNRTEYVTDYRVTVSNGKTKSAVVDYSEQLGGNWQITQESLAHQKTSSSTVLWKIPVPANGQTILTYQVHVL
jgi:hypothetical protein